MTREWNGSLVMEDFAKIAAESGLITTDFGKPVVGNPDKETPVEGHRRYEPGKEYGVTKETGEELIGKAHPKDAKPAEAMGDGALVENIVQQQEKDIEVATSMPSGALVGKHAELVNRLVALANNLEGEGKAEAAARIDKAIGRISDIPFGNDLRKEAIGPFAAMLLFPLKWLLWGGAAAGVGAGAMGWLSALTSQRETLAVDIQDVLDVAAKIREDDPSLSAAEGKLRSILLPYVAKFRKAMPVPGDEAGLREYIAILEDFAKNLPDIKSLVEVMVAVKGGFLERIGFGQKARLEQKLQDMVTSFQATMKGIQAAAKVGKEQMPEPTAAQPETGIAGIQVLLAERGLKVPQTGKLDDKTIAALRQLEKQLDTDLRRDPKMAEILERRGWSVVGALLRQDGTVADESVLRRLLSLADSIAK